MAISMPKKIQSHDTDQRFNNYYYTSCVLDVIVQ